VKLPKKKKSNKFLGLDKAYKKGIYWYKKKIEKGKHHGIYHF
jgi:hypothetical protein